MRQEPLPYTLYQGDCRAILATLPPQSVHCVVTSPPYFGLRDYQCEGQLGLEPTLEGYVEALLEVFREVKRVLRDDGTLWLVLGDSFFGNASAGGEATRTCDNPPHARDRHLPTKRGSGLKAKDLCGVPWRVAFALQADGWYLRSDIIWAKLNPMPESVQTRPTRAHEYVFLMTKQPRYWYNAAAIAEPCVDPDDDRKAHSKAGQKTLPTALVNGMRPGSATYAHRNKRSVWSLATQPFSGTALGGTTDHFAVYPERLVEPCILAGCPAQCCPTCGQGYVAVTERTSQQRQTSWSGSGRANGCVAGGGHQGRTGIWSTAVVDHGTVPACSCLPAPPVPGTVLDPFLGSGTTLAVTVRLGRQGIGIELSPAYLALAERRIALAAQQLTLPGMSA